MKKQIIIALIAFLSVSATVMAQDSVSVYQALANEAQKVEFIKDPGVELRSVEAQDSLKQVVFNIYLVPMPEYVKSRSGLKEVYNTVKYDLSEVKSFEKDIYKYCKSLPSAARMAVGQKNGNIIFKFYDPDYNKTGKQQLMHVIKMTRKEYLTKKEFYQLDDGGSYRW